MTITTKTWLGIGSAGVMLFALTTAGCTDGSSSFVPSPSGGGTSTPAPTPPPTGGGASASTAAPGSHLAYAGRVLEGNVVELAGSGAGAATVDWGDGTVQAPALTGGQFTTSHAYGDQGTYIINVSYTGGTAYAQSYTQIVTNAMPQVADLPDVRASSGSPVTLGPMAFTDGGSADTHTAQIDWGDGTVEAGAVDAVARTVTGSHTYASDGLHTVSVRVTDNNGVSGSGTLRVFCGADPFLTGFLSLSTPARLAWANGVLYASDAANGVVAFGGAGNRLSPPAPGVTKPSGLAVAPGPSPKLYVCDAADGSVRIFQGGAAVGALGQGAGEFAQPAGVAIDTRSGGKIYVVDAKADTLRIYDSGTNALWSPGAGNPVTGPAGEQLVTPIDVAVNEARNEVYVADIRETNTGSAIVFRVAVFDLLGVWLRDILAPAGAAGSPAWTRPSGLHFAADTLYVSSAGISSVAVVGINPGSGAATLQNQLGYRGGAQSGELSLPNDVVTDGSAIFVSMGESRIQIFEAGP